MVVGEQVVHCRTQVGKGHRKFCFTIFTLNVCFGYFVHKSCWELLVICCEDRAYGLFFSNGIGESIASDGQLLVF